MQLREKRARDSPGHDLSGHFDRSFRTARHYTKACFRHNLAGRNLFIFSGGLRLKASSVVDHAHVNAAAEYLKVRSEFA